MKRHRKVFSCLVLPCGGLGVPAPQISQEEKNYSRGNELGVFPLPKNPKYEEEAKEKGDREKSFKPYMRHRKSSLELFLSSLNKEEFLELAKKAKSGEAVEYFRKLAKEKR